MHSAAEVNCTDQTEMYIFNHMGYETKRKLKLTMNLAMFCSVLLDCSQEGGGQTRRKMLIIYVCIIQIHDVQIIRD
jgi:hypothetical protein